MARAKATDPLRSKTKPNAVEELTRGIATLRELIVQIEDLSRDGFPYREAVRARTELSFRETIRRLFGEKSPEYQAHKTHKLRVGSRAESAQSTALLKEFIAALEIQKAELLGLKPDGVIAVVQAEPDPPSLTVVPLTTPPDSPTAPNALEPAPLEAESVPGPPALAAKARATINPLPPFPSPTSAPSPGVAPLRSISANDAVASAPRNTEAPHPLQSPPPVDSVSTEATVALQNDMARPPATPLPPDVAAARATPPPTSSSTTRAATDAPISPTTIPATVPVGSAIPQGTIPPVPHTTLRARPSPSISTESPVPPQAIAIVTTAPATPTPVVTPHQSPAPSSATQTARSRALPAADTQTVDPIIQTTPPAPMSASSMLREEPPAPPPVAQATTPVQPLPLLATQSTVPENAEEAKAHVNDGTLETLRRVCARFHLVARQLRLRKEYRPTLEINDECDLQDLFYALLRLQFDEVGTEDWSPAYANGKRRTSYLLDWEKTVVVVKQTRAGLSTKDLAEQVAADKVHYSARPNGATLLCFIYDPEGRVGNPRGLEADLTSTEKTYRVEVIVAPK